MTYFINQEDLKKGKITSKLNVYVSVVKEKDFQEYPQYTSSEIVYENLKNMINLDREYFLALLLDARARLTGLHVVSIGTTTASLVNPADAFRAAIASHATGVIFVHNHPSGDPEASTEDLTTTARLHECSKLLGIKMWDHIIIGQNKYYSFADQGWLEEKNKL